MSYQSTNRY